MALVSRQFFSIQLFSQSQARIRLLIYGHIKIWFCLQFYCTVNTRNECWQAGIVFRTMYCLLQARNNTQAGMMRYCEYFPCKLLTIFVSTNMNVVWNLHIMRLAFVCTSQEIMRRKQIEQEVSNATVILLMFVGCFCLCLNFCPIVL